MGQFLTQNLFELIASVLLAGIGGIAVYFIRKMESVEGRVRDLEVKNPSIEQRIVALDKKVDERTKHLDERMEDMKEFLSEKIDALQELMKDGGP